MKDSGRYWELPTDSYPELQQGIALLSASKHKPAAEAFVEYVLSAEGAAVLEQYGFRVPRSK
jgi:ABC-type molybdate transport system substrate-binding protein